MLFRCFQGFTSAGTNLRCFQALWRWSKDRLPSRPHEGYTLDLDSTRLLHEDGHQEGVAVGYAKKGLKPCLHPLLAVIAEVRLVARLWLRPGNAACGNNAMAFFRNLSENLLRQVRLRGVRADSRFGLPKLLSLLEELSLPYVVVAQLRQPMQMLLKVSLQWQSTEVYASPAAVTHPAPGAREDEGRVGKRLLDVPGYRFRALVTSLPAATHSPLSVWRYYNGRADCENVIKELQEGFALPTLCPKDLWATEAVLSLATLTHYLTVLFQRNLE